MKISSAIEECKAILARGELRSAAERLTEIAERGRGNIAARSDAFYFAACAWIDLGRYDTAIPLAAQAYTLCRKDRKKALCVTNALNCAHRPAEALQVLHRIHVELGPCHIVSTHAAQSYNLLGEYAKADKAFRQAYEQAPGHRFCAQNLVFHLLLMGKWKAAWRGVRTIGQKTPPTGQIPKGVPHWDGAPTAHLMIVRDQGMGDVINFRRVLCHGAVRSRLQADRITWHIQPALEAYVAPLTTLNDEPAVANWHMAEHPEPDEKPTAWCGTLELLAFADVSQRDMEVAFAVSPRRPRPSSAPAAPPRIGLCWQGNPRYKRDTARSLTPDHVRAIVDRLHAVGFDVQHLQPKADPEFRDLIGAGKLRPTGALRNFMDTARLLDQCTAVITVDTAMVHVAADCGVPTHMLNRIDSDWRWGTHGPRSCMYPTVMVHRQRRSGDWQAPIDDAINAVTEAYRTPECRAEGTQEREERRTSQESVGASEKSLSIQNSICST